MKPRYVKRIVFFLILLILLMGIFLSNSIYLKVLFLIFTIVFVGLLIFLRNGSSSQTKIDQYENIDNKSSEEDSKVVISDSEKKIITDVDLQEEIQVKITPITHKNIKEEYLKIINEPFPNKANPKDEFSFIVDKILDAIKTIYFSHSAILFLYKREKQQILFHNYVSDEDNLQRIRFNLGSDIISKVIISGNPNYTSNINSNIEMDLIKYYPIPVGIKSIAAVPVYFNNKIFGVLAIDSKSDDAFGPETIYTLGKFVRIITFLINLYEDKFNKDLIDRRLEAILDLVDQTNSLVDEMQLIQKYVVAIDKSIEWDVLAIVLYDPVAQNYILKKLFNRTSLDYMGEGLPVDIHHDTLIGMAIRKCQNIKIDNLVSRKYPLYNRNSYSSINGSLIIVPMSHGNNIYGAIVLESLKKKNYSDDDVRVLEKIMNLFAYQLNNIRIKKMFEANLNIDLETKLLTRREFEKRIKDDLEKFNSLDINVGLALINIERIDKLIDQYGNKVISYIAKEVAKILIDESDNKMLIGRLEPVKFGVFFFNWEGPKINVWSQKIIHRIMGKAIDTDSGTISVIANVGYTADNKIKNADILFQNAETALSRAMLEGGGKIRTII